MKHVIGFLTVIDLLFIFLLALSGAISEIGGEIVYYLSFLIPFASAVAFIKIKSLDIFKIKFVPTKENGLLSLPIIAPALLLIFAVSFLTNLLLSLFSSNSTVDVSGNIFTLILLHALLPAVLEEALFRYIPLKLIAPYSKSYAVIISALYFSLVHCNLYQIPYAFVAGIVFAAVDIMAESILPSFVFHLLNNLLSIVWLKYAVNDRLQLIYIMALLALAVLSAVFIVIYRRKYSEKIKKLISDNSKQELSFAPAAFSLVALAMALLNLQI